MERWESLAPKLTFITRAATQAIDAGTVTYSDSEGQLHTIEADTVVVSGGMTSNVDDALQFAACAPAFEIIGDCATVENLQAAIRSAYAAASRL